jgi:AraC-like DNA-binding protein
LFIFAVKVGKMVNLIAVFGALAFFHALFLAAFFWRRREGGPVSNRLLALLLAALAVRITKSVIGIVFPPTQSVAPVFAMIGMVSIGPCLWLYLRSLYGETVVFSKKTALHFVFSGLVVAVFPFLKRGEYYEYYLLSVAHMFVYTALGIRFLSKKRSGNPPDADTRRWAWLLCGAVGLIWCTFFLQFIAETTTTYLILTACAAVVLYAFSFWGMTRMKVFSKNTNGKNHKNIGPAEENLNELAGRIAQLFEREKTFTDAQLSVNRLAERLHAPSYLVSKAINAVLQKTFPELLADYRSAEAARRLREPGDDYLSIEGIASECGFQSMSAFYTAFKRAYGMTPAEWRKGR